MRPTADLAALDASTGRMLTWVEGLDAGVVTSPSRLPDWTIGHLLTHLARNADGNTGMIEAAARGEVRPQYPHGRDGRAADIEAGSRRPGAEIIDDVRRSAERLADALDAMPDEAWSRPVQVLSGEIPARSVPGSRRREVEFHLVDLGLGYTPTDWPADLVDRELGRIVGDLPSRLPVGTELEIISSDTGVGWSVGDGDVTTVVRGPAPWLLAWVIGRDVPDGALVAPDGLPELAPW